jgi:methionine-gamma-lyase
MKKKLSLDTLAIQAGEAPNENSYGAIRLPLHMSTSFEMPELGEELLESMFLSTDRPQYHCYTRWTNPTLRAFEDRMAALEGAEAGLAFAGGMAAISSLLLTYLSQGDHIIVSDACYYGTLEFMGSHLPRWGIQVSRVNTSDLEAVKAAVRPNTKIIYIETPANPLLRVADIAALADVAHTAKALFVVDSTFAGPTLQQPLSLGADYVIHSATKYLCGHGDALGGVIVGNKQGLYKIRTDGLLHLGGTMSPFNAWLILRGIMTLPVRMERHCQNALTIARFLETHPAITRVNYPGLESHPQHVLAKRQMLGGFGGMISIQLRGGLSAMMSLMEKVKVFTFATSLGHLRSMLYYYSTDVLLQMQPALDPRQKADILEWMGKDGVVRINVGLEEINDLIEDLDQALKGRTLRSRVAPFAFKAMLEKMTQG